MAIAILFSTAIFAKEKTFTKEATEEAGTFITSELNIKNYEITKDEFTSFAGSISKVKVEKKESFMKDKQQLCKSKNCFFSLTLN